MSGATVKQQRLIIHEETWRLYTQEGKKKKENKA